ncbi:response regulator [Marivibrio halodurans]|uniref:Response regulator n=2 Tax=Marivibrio halodurans TaxID=2039722 RepID=A0A8J7V179_9PROT|nr:response regulator [Marivibrio halodurans]
MEHDAAHGAVNAGDGTRVLVIDDDAAFTASVAESLEPSGFELDDVTNGEAGIEKLRAEPFDLILLDVRTPGVNGFEFLDWLRNTEADYRDLPVIMISDLAQGSYKDAATKIGADRYLVKPIDFDELRITAESLIEHRRERARRAESGIGEKLKRILSSKTAASAGLIRVVDLQEFRTDFGEDFERLESRIAAIAERVLADALGEGESYARHGTDGFVVLFKDRSLHAANDRTLSIADSVRAAVLGELGMNVAVHREVLRPADLRNEDGSVSLDLVDRAFEMEDRRGKRPARGAWYERQISLVFQPIWLPADKEIAYQLCGAKRETDYGTFTGRYILHGRAKDPAVADVDLWRAEMLVGALKNPTNSRRDLAPVIFPVHASSLVGENARRLRDVLDAIPDSAPAIYADILDFPISRTAQASIAILRRSKEIFDDAIVRLEPTDRHAAVLRGAGLSTLSLNLERDLGVSNFLSDRAKLRMLGRIVAEYHEAGFSLMLFGVETLVHVQGVLRTGVKAVAGAPIGPPQRPPLERSRLESQQVLGR